jgi:two-component system, OmpR family, alkaline phosphatase synthesis response regulator PhoP
MNEILIIEDDDEINFVLNFMLNKEGFKTTSLSDGREAMSHLHECKPSDLILLDIMLPYCDGFQIIEAAKKNKAWAHVPIIMLTAKSQDNDVKRAMSLGADDYILKPFLPDEIINSIRNLLK